MLAASAPIAWIIVDSTKFFVAQIAAAHGASHADVLTVAAAKCTTEVLGGTVDIASHCEAADIPLYVSFPPFSAC